MNAATMGSKHLELNEYYYPPYFVFLQPYKINQVYFAFFSEVFEVNPDLSTQVVHYTVYRRTGFNSDNLIIANANSF